jgi:hypothetical protein
VYSKLEITKPSDYSLTSGSVPTFSWEIPADAIDNEEFTVGLKSSVKILDLAAEGTMIIGEMSGYYDFWSIGTISDSIAPATI